MRLALRDGGNRHRVQVKGEANIDSATLGFSPADRETLVFAIEPLQSCLCVGKPDTTSPGGVYTAVQGYFVIPRTRDA